jgi:prepilin-type N-terminal cleavage/methylation domain-containing protein
MVRSGFTLIELMIVVSILAFLSMISVPNFLRFLAKAKRTEAYMNLGSLYVAEKSYWAENGKYSTKLTGKDGIGWQPEGQHFYTYGFNGGEFVQGKLKAPQSALGSTRADTDSFIAAAAGDIDGDGVMDLLTVDQFNNIQLVKNDLD